MISREHSLKKSGIETMLNEKRDMSVMRFSVVTIAAAEKCDANMQVEAEQYSHNIPKNWMILSLNILINNILSKK